MPIRHNDMTIRVLATKEEIDRWREAISTACDHPETELRDQIVSGGGTQRKHQCLICGSAKGGAAKLDKSVHVPQWDTSLRSRWEEGKADERREIEELWVERTEELVTDGYELYLNYISSDDWRYKRKRILQRDGNICQACLAAKASEVHHHTYDNLYEEFMFELVAVCRPCHERLHSKKLAALAAKSAKAKDR